MAHKWAEWLHNPCRLGDPHRLGAGGKIRSGPLVGKMATQPLPPWGSPLPQSAGQNQKWPTSGQGGYTTNPCRIGDPHRIRAGGKIRSGPQVCKMATQPLPPWGYPTPQSGGQNQKGPTSGKSGYITPGPWGIATALERGAKSEVAHKWARWLHNPCRLGGPLRRRAIGAGGTIRIGPLVGKVTT